MTLKVQGVRSEYFTSNIYILSNFPEENQIFLIDAGAYQPVLDLLPTDVDLKGIFITHYHYDHIYFLNQWIAKFPKVQIYGSAVTKTGIASSKKNLSFYHENPVEINLTNFVGLSDRDRIHLFENEFLQVIETEGHCEGSLSYNLNTYLFTGDALIPNLPIVTKLKTGNRDLARNSIIKLKEYSNSDFTILPGHMESISAIDIDWDSYL